MGLGIAKIFFGKQPPQMKRRIGSLCYCILMKT